VSRSQFGNVTCNWNIDSTACCQTKSLTCTSCSFPIDVSQSEGKLRNKRIQPRE
jgi:hypothetical protein